MKIEIKKFGTILVSRQLGREAYAAFLPYLKEIAPKEKVKIDFSGVAVLSPSWADEFLTPLNRQFKERLELNKFGNPSVTATLAMLEKVNKIKFKISR